MDEINQPTTETETVPEAPIEQPAPGKNRASAWREYIETEEATRLVYLIFGLIAIAMVMGYLQSRTAAICCGDWDGYYHIRWSSLLWENFSSGRWLPTFEWLPLTVLNPQDYNDHHFLFHLMQIPFLWFFEPVTAAKVAAVVFSTLAIFSVYWMIYRYKIGYQLIWLAAIMTCGNMFFYRMNMAKAPPLTIIMTIAGIYLLFERKYVWLFPLMFAFVWTYSLFPLLWIASLIWIAIIGWNEHRFEWRPVAYTTAGMIAGNIINPYFPANIGLFYEHFATKIKIGADFAVQVGGEWYPYNGMELLTHFPVAMGAMLIGYILFVPRQSKLPEKATFFLVFVTVLLAAQFRSKRFAEYFPPFAILFAAFSWQSFTTGAKHSLPEDFQREIEPFLDAQPRAEKHDAWYIFKQGAAWVVGIVLVITFLVNLVGLQKFGIEYGGLVSNIVSNEKNDRYRASMEWAQAPDADGGTNIPADEIIFNSNWDDFPKLFYYNTNNRYVYGLDPNYLYSENPELYKLLKEITTGETDEAGPLIREKFGARYIFADAKENTAMIAKLFSSGWADTVYVDSEARILKLREQKGDPGDEFSNEPPETEEEKRILDAEEANSPATPDEMDGADADDETE